MTWAGIRTKRGGVRDVEIIFWRESQDLVIYRK